MKGLILSGGAGTRLRPITHTSAKQLVPVANKPILFYGIEDMVAAGIVDIGIIVGDTRAEIMEAVGDGSAFGARVTYIPQDEPLGLAHCVLIARDFLGDDDFVMYLGDNMLEQGLEGFVERFEAAQQEAGTPTLEGGAVAPSAQILLCPVPDPHRFGVAEVDAKGHVVRLVEKPADPPSNLALVGVYLFTPAIHDAVRAIKPSGRGELEITDAIQYLIDQGNEVRPHLVDGWWKDTGKLEDLLEANRLIMEDMQEERSGTADASSRLVGNVVLQEGARVENTTIRGPAVIGRGSRVVDSFIGPYTSIGDECTIEDSEIEHSVIMERCVVRGMHRLEDSLLGKEVTVERSDDKPKAYRLMVGDHGRVGVI